MLSKGRQRKQQKISTTPKKLEEKGQPKLTDKLDKEINKEATKNHNIYLSLETNINKSRKEI